MNPQTCCTCYYFRRHYILDEQSCTPVNCGHCTYPHLKHRQANTPACSNFRPQTSSTLPDRNQVIHYLTTDLLKHILSLELPPKIEAEDEGFDLHFCPEGKN